MSEIVLVVDDAHDIRNFLKNYILKPRGFEILVAVDAAEALAIVAKDRPDLIITDMVLPQMSGLDMLEKLKEQGFQIPAILTTAHGSEETAIRALRLGVKDYVVKPFDVPDIVQAIDKALKETRLQRERDLLTEQLLESSNALQHRMEEFNTLYDTSKSITSSLNLQEVLNRVAEAAVRITGAEEGFLMLIDEENDELYVRASKNLNSEVREMRLAVRDGLAGQVMAYQKPIVIDDQDRWEKIKTAYLVRSLIYVPLISRGKSIGILGVVNRNYASTFTIQNAEAIFSLADYAAIAIQNANLYSLTENARFQLHASLRQTNVPMILVDDKGVVVFGNKPIQNIFNLSGVQIEGRRISELPQSENLTQLLHLIGNGNQNRSFQTEIELDNGQIFGVQVDIIEKIGRSIVMNEITKLKETARLKSEFVAAVSHDLRSPLTAIRGYVELLDRAGPLSETQRKFVNHVYESISHITTMINDLLDLDQLESDKNLLMKPCQLDEIMREVVASYALQVERKQQKLILDLPTIPLPQILGNTARLRQLLANLIGNAVKYTPDQGQISCRIRQAVNQLIITISDTGIGISADDKLNLFERFFRADAVKNSHPGTGLGLSIVKSVVERHNGRIWVHSEPNKGSTFTVVFPFVQNNGTEIE